MLKAAFINGLRPDIQAELRQLEPVGLSGKMTAAQNIEDKQMALKAYHVSEIPRWHKPSSLSSLLSHRTMHVPTVLAVPRAMRLLPPTIAANNSPTHQFPPPHPPPFSTTSITTTPSHPSPPSFRRLTNCEMQIRRERGLCFHCDERFSPGHRYNQKTLQVLWVMDEEEEGTDVFAISGTDPK